jgi:hypothetical protein
VSQGMQVTEADEKGLRWTAAKLIFIPDFGDLRLDCIEPVHAPALSSHFKILRTFETQQVFFFGPTCAMMLNVIFRPCDSCQKVNASKQRKVGHLQPLQIPGSRCECISVDLTTDLPPYVYHKDSILVVAAGPSKMCHLKACAETIPSEGVARIIENRIFRYHGVPSSIVSPSPLCRDVRFTSQVWEELMHDLGSQLRRFTT